MAIQGSELGQSSQFRHKLCPHCPPLRCFASHMPEYALQMLAVGAAELMACSLISGSALCQGKFKRVVRSFT
jgi:hypothetical protein